MEREGGFSHFSSSVVAQVSGQDIADFDAMFSSVSLQSLVAPAVGAPFPPLPVPFHYLTEKQRFVGETYETYKSNAFLDSAVSGNAAPKKPKLESVSESSTRSLPRLPPLSFFLKPKLELETTESLTHSLPPLPLSFISESFLQLPLLDSSKSTHKLNLVDSVEAPPLPPMIRRRSNLARQKRQMVSDKIRCLEKLMPWDKKMPIAKMLEEAYKYVRYLEAQIKALKSMPRYSSQTLTLTEEGGHNTDLVKLNRQQLLQVLMNSPVAQTMMYSKGYCVVSAEQLVVLDMNIMHHARRNWNNSTSNDNVGGGCCEGNNRYMFKCLVE